MTKYEMEFESLIRNIVQQELERALQQLEVRVVGNVFDNGDINVHSVIYHNGRALRGTSSILPAPRHG